MPTANDRLEKKLTAFERKALLYLHDHPRGVKAADIAAHLWPDSVMHRKVSNQGNGACRGKAAWLCGGAYLSKLAKRHLVRMSWTFVETGVYYLTEEGRALLAASDEVEQ